jgi:uncharacterized protein with FMN-binding domain
MRRAAVALILTAAAVVALVSYRTHPPKREHQRPPAPARPAPRPHPPGTRAVTGVAISTPYTTIQVRAFVLRGRLIDVQEVMVENDNAHTRAINQRAVPILHEEALRAGSAHVHTVSGATGTSASYKGSLQSAIDQAHG